MDNSLVYRDILVFLASIITLVYLSIKYFKGGNIANPDKAVAPLKKFVEKNGRNITTLLYLIILMLCLIVIVSSIPVIKDIPNIMNKNYESISGKAMTSDKSGYKRQVRSITILDERSQKKMTIEFLSRKNIEKGDYLKLYYYPVSKIGAYQNPQDDE